MQNIYYIATIFAAAIVCLMTSLLLFARRNDGERSRVILACIILFSVFSYSTRFIELCQGYTPTQVISTPMLLVAIFMSTSYIMYPIEVISPGFLNFRRIVQIYVPWMILLSIYILCEWSGIEFFAYNSLIDMLPNVAKFEVWFRLLLALLFLAPVLNIFFIPNTRQYNNAGKKWIYKYITLFTINTIAYILVLTFDFMFVKTVYYYISVGCSLGIAYMELFSRLYEKKASKDWAMETIPNTQPENTLPVDIELPQTLNNQTDTIRTKPSQNPSLLDRLPLYMNQTCAYRDPDLSINSLAAALYTNRTTLALIIQELGYESFTKYVNALRVDDFIANMKSGKSDNFQDEFYNAGFRSRATAIRNFRQITGMTPSEYFQ